MHYAMHIVESCLNCKKLYGVYHSFTPCGKIQCTWQIQWSFTARNGRYPWRCQWLRLETRDFKHMQVSVQSEALMSWLKERKEGGPIKVLSVQVI